MRLNHKSALRIALLLLLVALLVAMVVPYTVFQLTVREFAPVLQWLAGGVKLTHLFSFGIIGFVAHFTSKPWRIWHALGLLTVASTVEVVQISVPGEHAAVSHIIFDVLGGMGGFGLAWLVACAWEPARASEAPSSTYWY
jgi:hypothetical protein